MSNMINLVSLAIFTVTLAIGQFLFKRAGLAIRGRPILEGLTSLAFIPEFYAALTVYGLSTFLWVWILSRVSLMQAYPWVSAGVVIVPLASWYLFDEKVLPLFWVGIGFIVIGIILTQLGTADSL